MIIPERRLWQVLEHTVRHLEECTGYDTSLMELFTDTDVTAIEAYDIQATVFQKVLLIRITGTPSM